MEFLNLAEIQSFNNSDTSKLAVENSLDTNAERIAFLRACRDRLQADLKNSAQLLRAVDRDVVSGSKEVVIKPVDDVIAVGALGTVIALSQLSTKQLAADDSPFKKDVLKRKEYINHTVPRPFIPKERKILTNRVQAENQQIKSIQDKANDNLYSLEVAAKNADHANIEGIKWERIAFDVSASSSTHHAKRSARDCKVQWLGTDHPSLVKDSQWTAADDHVIIQFTDDKDVRQGDVNWSVVAEHFSGTRTAAQCLSRYFYLEELAESATREPGAWSVDQDAELSAAVADHGVGNWVAVSLALEYTRSPAQCYTRYTASVQPSITRDPWTEREEKLLNAAVIKYGEKWARVKDMLPGRTGPQCREHFMRTVRRKPNAKQGRWSKKEDALLREAREEMALTDWLEVAEHVDTRLGLQCRKRWEIIISKEVATQGSPKPSPAEAIPLQTHYDDTKDAVGSPASSLSSLTSLSDDEIPKQS